MTSEISSAIESPAWEDTLPHFSVSEKGNRITAPPLDAPGMLGFFAVVTFVLWIPSGAGAALFFYGVREQNPPAVWQWVASVLYTFLPGLLIGLTADQARDRFGQRTTANRIAAIPAFSGVGVGLLIVALWVGGFDGGIIALASVACWAGAAIATTSAWAGIRYTRRRQAWMASMRQYGIRTPGVLRDVTFLERWSDSRPLFTVVVEFAAESGAQRVTANMVTTTRRVPRPGAAVVVTRAPHDPHGEVLIEFDFTKEPEFDRNAAKYTQPSGT
ncbi:hypothetical protein H7J87_29110 [Mycolicibacterium wolinskyi]|uniref:DUF3592 domain-containing protein n=1 Tax=Mycolicibacterium wolinskyi TaxID=59750 RepID=A0A1X2FJZ8_9MYCO|nr:MULTISPECIES: hypothetical protein [Mycolicibacterium]MCV7289396.1 hypothetical protein [Mycolicibacterium wolinskyi]MCV7297389.1 hypothetical protein [Mycolicibacterium goodii]ORX18765.1 hypothetical protein AWC31_12305 [Mycolicibacterium wolinskyi]